MSMWKEYINPEEFEMLIDFVNKSKHGEKWGNKYIYLYCNDSSLKDRCINDICEIVGKDDCEFYEEKSGIHVVDEYEKNEKNDEDEDEDEEVSFDTILKKAQTEEINTLHKKLLIFNEKVLDNSNEAFIKDIVSCNQKIYYSPGETKIIKPTCNIIIHANERIHMNYSMVFRTVFIEIVSK